MVRTLRVIAVLVLVLAGFLTRARATGVSITVDRMGMTPILFSQLPATVTNGWMYYLSDGTPTNPCGGGGTGAFAQGIGGQWSCAGAGTTTLPICSGSVVLSGVGTGLFSAPCVSTASYCSCHDTTANSSACYTGNPIAGQVAVFGNETDTAQVACTQVALGLPGLASYSGPINIQGTSNTGTDAINGTSVNGVLNAQAFGAKGDALYSGDYIRTNDGVTNGTTTFTAATGNFTSALVGDAVFIAGAGAAGGMYIGTVAGFSNPTTLTLSSAPPTSGTNLYYAIGFDNTTPLQNWANAVRGGIATNAYGVRGGRAGYLPTGIYLHRGLNFGGMYGMTIDGAGPNIASDGRYSGGSMLLCMVPTTGGGTGMANGCHDFTGDGGLSLNRIAFVDGVVGMTGSAGTWNFMLARHPTAGFCIINRIADTTFHSAGAWNVVILNSEQNTWIDDGFNGNADPAHAIYIGTDNTPGFVSPFYGSYTGAGLSATVNRFLGGKTQISTFNNDAVVMDGLIGDFSVNDAYIHLSAGTDSFFVDNPAHPSGCIQCSFTNDRVEAYGSPAGGGSFIKLTGVNSYWNSGIMHAVTWAIPGGSTQTAPIINMPNGNINAVNITGLSPNSFPNPEVVFKGGGDDYFGDVAANLIKVNGTVLNPTSSTFPYYGNNVSINNSGPDALQMTFTNQAAGAQPWALYTEGTGAAGFWGPGGIGLDMTNVQMWGISSNGVMRASTGIAVQKQTATPAIIGAGNCQIYAGAGTTAGSCKLFVMCGTSGIASVLLDNIGSGC